MYLIYKNIKSILPPTIEGKTIKFLNVPLNEPIIILGVKENNGEVKVAKKEYNFNGKSTELNNYETVSLEEFKDLMNNLDKI